MIISYSGSYSSLCFEQRFFEFNIELKGMKRLKYVWGIFLLIPCAFSFAQESTPEKSLIINTGVGIAPTFLGAGVNVGVPPIGVSVEYMVTEEIGVGGYLGFTSFNSDFLGFRLKGSYLILGVRGSYHVELDNPKWRPYAGGFLGYLILGGDVSIDDGSSSVFGYSIHGGIRYLISEQVGVFGELGYGLSILQIGATFQL